VEDQDNVSRNAGLNIIRQLLSQIPYEHLPMPEVEFPPRQKADGYRETDRSRRMVEDWYGKQAKADKECKEQRKRQKQREKAEKTEKTLSEGQGQTDAKAV